MTDNEQRDQSLKVNVDESIGITDHISMTTHLSPGIYLEEFKRYKSEVVDTDGGKGYALSYILLQLYVENHIHYYLRFLIGGGFTSAFVAACWKEKDYPLQKLNCFMSELRKHNFQFTEKLFAAITIHYKTLTDIRNLLAHGHPITSFHDGSTIELSDAKAFLAPKAFNEVLEEANIIVSSWNQLMDELAQQDSLLRITKMPRHSFFNECKFKSNF